MVDKEEAAAAGQGVMKNWPTHEGDSEFWEELGRTVATFGFLELIIAKALFPLTGSMEQERELTEEDFQAWIKQLQDALSVSIGRLAPMLETAFQEDSRISQEEKSDIIFKLEQLKQWRNILCYAAWVKFNTDGEGRPIFINWKNEIYDGFCLEILFRRSATRQLNSFDP